MLFDGGGMENFNKLTSMSAVNVADDPRQSGVDEMLGFEPEFTSRKCTTEPHALRSARRSVLVAFLLIFLVAFGIISGTITLPF